MKRALLAAALAAAFVAFAILFVYGVQTLEWPPKRPSPHPAKSASNSGKTNESPGVFSYARIRPYINSAANYCTSTRPNDPSEWRKKFICESKVTDAIIAVLTVFLAAFTFGLLWVGFRQERTTRQHLRAFVFLDGTAIFNVADPLMKLPGYTPTGAELISPNEGPLVRLGIKNTGSTPAFNVVHAAVMQVGPYPFVGFDPTFTDQGFKTAPKSSIPPGGVTTKNVNWAAPLTADEIVGLRGGTLAIYVFGEIRYRDAFRRNRITKYRQFHNSQSGTVGVTTELSWDMSHAT